MNRLTLHLRSYSADLNSEEAEPAVSPFIAKRRRRNSWLGASTLGAVDMSSDADNALLKCMIYPKLVLVMMDYMHIIDFTA